MLRQNFFKIKNELFLGYRTVFPLLILSPGYYRSPCVPLMAEDVIAEVQVSMNLRETVGIVFSDYLEALCLRSNTFT